MRGIICLIGLLVNSVVAFPQSDLKSIVAATEMKIQQNQVAISHLPDSLYQAGCEALIYFDSTGLYKLEIGCGDVSMEMTQQYFYFLNDELVYMIGKRYHFNAPPTYTEDVAKKDGATSGWFDPKKTKVIQYECYLQHGRMVRFVENDGKEISADYESFKKTETVILADANNGITHYRRITRR